VYVVQVSARLLQFPRLCCCCGRPGPSENYRASATRTTGKKVLKTDTRSWTFPICRDCLAWIAVQRAANGLWGLFIALLVCAAGGGVFGLVSIREPAGVLFLLCGLALGGISPFAYKGWKSKQSQADAIKPNPDCSTVPVVYVAWRGSVHTFQFASVVFCEEFRRANAKKVLG
jgi:hypothetical protein